MYYIDILHTKCNDVEDYNTEKKKIGITNKNFHLLMIIPRASLNNTLY